MNSYMIGLLLLWGVVVRNAPNVPKLTESLAPSFVNLVDNLRSIMSHLTQSYKCEGM